MLDMLGQKCHGYMYVLINLILNHLNVNDKCMVQSPIPTLY